MATTRIRRVSSEKEKDNVLDDYITQGYDVISQGHKSARVRKKTWGTAGGHIVCAIFTVWWTFGIGNLVYAVIAHYNADQVLVKLEGEEQS